MFPVPSQKQSYHDTDFSSVLPKAHYMTQDFQSERIVDNDLRPVFIGEIFCSNQSAHYQQYHHNNRDFPLLERDQRVRHRDILIWLPGQ